MRASSSAFKHSWSSTSELSLSSSSRWVRKCSSSSACFLASRARRSSSSTFSHAQLCSSDFRIGSSEILSSSSDFKHACYSTSDFSLDASDFIPKSSSSTLCLASRSRLTPYSTFSRACSWYFAPDLHLRQGVPPLLPSNMPDPLAHISALPLQLGGPLIQPSAINPPPQISTLLLKLDVLHLRPSYMYAAAPHPPLLSYLLQGQGGPPTPPSGMRAHAPLLSALLHKQVEPII